MTTPPDRRVHAYRPDLADARLQGLVMAERYVTGQPAMITSPTAPVRQSPHTSAALDTEALYGETVDVFERHDGWAWVQLATDRYVGYVPEAALGEAGSQPTHVVGAPETFVFPRPDIKSPPSMALPLGARIIVRSDSDTFVERDSGDFVFARHVHKLGEPATDWVCVAQGFIGTPYLWGGRSRRGIDCSGLVQMSLMAAGFTCPRDSDMQRQSLGTSLPLDMDLSLLVRGDLVFWPGHVGIVVDPVTLLHANAHHMMTVAEPLGDVIARSNRSNVPMAAIKRLSARH